MAIKTYEQYIASLKAMRPNIYKWDSLIEDVTTQTWNAYCNSLSQWADYAAEQGIISPQERQIVQKNVITTAARHYLLIRARK